MAMTRRQMLEFEAEQRRKQNLPPEESRALYRQGVGGREETVTTATRADVAAARRGLETDSPITPVRPQVSPITYRAQDALPGTRGQNVPANPAGVSVGTVDNPANMRRTKGFFESRGLGSPEEVLPSTDYRRTLVNRAGNLLRRMAPEGLFEPTPRANVAVNLGTGQREAPSGDNTPSGALSIADLKNMRGVGGTAPPTETFEISEKVSPSKVPPLATLPQGDGAAARAASGSGQAVVGLREMGGKTYQVLEDGSLYMDAEGVEPIAQSGIQSFGGIGRSGVGPGSVASVTGRRLPGQRAGENGFTINRANPFQGASDAAIAPFAAAKHAQLQGGAAGGANILRQINNIHDKADRRYEQVRKQTGSSRAATRAADAIRSRADSLLQANTTQALREGNQLDAQSYDRRTASDQQYRSELIKQGYSELEADRLATAMTSVDDTFEELGRMYAVGDEDDPAAADRTAATASYRARQFAPSGLYALPPNQQRRTVAQSFEMARAADYIGKITKDRFDSREDLLNMRIEIDSGTALYDRLKTKEPRLRELIPLMGSDMSPWQYITGDKDMIAPNGGRLSLDNFVNETNMSTRELFAMLEDYGK